MHTVRYKGCIAQQDNKTGLVMIFKDGILVKIGPCDRRLSGKDLRGRVNQYLNSSEEAE